MKIGFLVWSLCGLFFIGMGIFSWFSKKPMGFWANAKAVKIRDEDIPKYNHASGRLWILYGMVFILLGFPMLKEQNNPMILLSVLGVFLETILLMLFILRIENKYRER